MKAHAEMRRIARGAGIYMASFWQSDIACPGDDVKKACDLFLPPVASASVTGFKSCAQGPANIVPSHALGARWM